MIVLIVDVDINNTTIVDSNSRNSNSRNSNTNNSTNKQQKRLINISTDNDNGNQQTTADSSARAKKGATGAKHHTTQRTKKDPRMDAREGWVGAPYLKMYDRGSRFDDTRYQTHA